MTETRRFAARPWTPADDEILRSLALRGVDARVIGSQLNRTAVAVRSRAAEHPAQENHPQALPDGLKARGMSELDPTPELPDDTPIDRVRFSTRIRNVLDAAGLKTVGEVREISDDTLLSFQDFGEGSVALIRETLGLPSCDGVRPDRRG
jgi:hypothetical protein